MTSDISTLTRAAGILRRWWLVAVVVAAGLGFAGATALGVGRVEARLGLVEHAVSAVIEIPGRVRALEGAIVDLPRTVTALRETVAELRGEVRALRAQRTDR